MRWRLVLLFYIENPLIMVQLPACETARYVLHGPYRF